MSEYLRILFGYASYHYQDMQKTFQEKLEEAPSAECGGPLFGLLTVQSAGLAPNPLQTNKDQRQRDMLIMLI